MCFRIWNFSDVGKVIQDIRHVSCNIARSVCLAQHPVIKYANTYTAKCMNISIA